MSPDPKFAKESPLNSTNDAARTASPQGSPGAQQRPGGRSAAGAEGQPPGQGDDRSGDKGNGRFHPPRWLRLTIEGTLGLIAGLVLLGGIVLWRLSSGPVEVDFLTPFLEAALSGGEEEFSVDVGETVLLWEGWPHNIDLRAREVTVLDGEDRPLVLLPAVAVTLSLRALLQGTVAPTYVELLDGILIVERNLAGEFEFGSEQPGAEKRDTGLVLGALLDEILSRPDPERRLSYLTAVRIREGRLIVRDRVLGAEWQANDLTLEVRRDPVGLAGELSMVLDLPGAPASAEAAFTYNRESGMIDAAGGFAGLRPASLAGVLPQLAGLEGLEISLDGSLTASLEPSGKLDAASFEMAGGPGLMTLQDRLPEPRLLRDLSLHGTYDGRQRLLTLERGEVRFGSEEEPGPGIAVEGQLALGGRPADPRGRLQDGRVEAQVRLVNFDMSQVERYWPNGFGQNARDWVVKNVEAGLVTDGAMNLDLLLPGGIGQSPGAGAQSLPGPDQPRAPLDPAAEGQAAAGTESGGSGASEQDGGEQPGADGADEPASGPRLVELGGRLVYEGLVVTYLPPMPPLTDIRGTATFDKNKLDFDVESARRGEIEVGRSDVTVSGFQTPGVEEIDIRFPARGSVPEILDLLNHERLGLIDKLGVDPAKTAGQGEVEAHFHFPLLSDLQFEQVEVEVDAWVHDGEVANVALGKDMTDAELALSVNQKGLSAQGPLKLGGVPLELEWQEFFSADAEQTSLYKVTVPSMTEADRERFGFDVLPGLTGPVSASVTAGAWRDGRNEVKAALNLESAGLSFPDVHWEKKRGEPGQARFTLLLQDWVPRSMPSIQATAEGFEVAGHLSFDEQGESLSRAVLERADFGLNRLTDVVLEPLGEGWAVSVEGGVLNAEPFISRAGQLQGGEEGGGEQGQQDGIQQAESGQGGGQEAASPGASAQSDEPPRPLKLTARNLQRVYFAKDRYLDEVGLDLDRTADGWQLIQAQAIVPARFTQPGEGSGEAAVPGQAQRVELSYLPTEVGGHTLSGTTGDLGALLRALDLFDTLAGGQVDVIGERPPGGALAGSLEVSDYRLVDAPVLARLLLVASLTGIVEGLSGDGLSFNRLTGDFTLDDGVFRSELMRAYGTSLGITANGSVNLDQDQLDVKGTIVPAYGINSILNDIPVLGTFLTGGEGEGLVAFTYTMTGPIDDPDISVNPLSALTPGFLRGIFSGEGTNEKPTLFPQGVQR